MNDETIIQFRKELQNLGYSKTVVNNYPKQIRAFLNHFKKSFTEITTKDILDYHNRLKTIIGTRTGKPFSESYIHSILLSIKLYFDYLQRTGLINLVSCISYYYILFCFIGNRDFAPVPLWTCLFQSEAMEVKRSCPDNFCRQLAILLLQCPSGRGRRNGRTQVPVPHGVRGG